MVATAARGAHIVGREDELARLGAFLDGGDANALVLTGGAGIGKTTLWEAAVALARERGLRVLSARASGAEMQLAFAALIDLLDGVSSEELADLPAPQLHALEVALLRAPASGTPPAAASVGVGFLNTLRLLSASTPLLVAVDDVQWLDSASAETVAFAARRLEGDRVRVLLAKRTRSSSLVERAHGPRGLERVEVGPLSFGAVQRLLAEQLDLTVPRHVLRRIVDSTLGNPLFALELGRSLSSRAPLRIGEDVPLPDSIEELLGTRVAALPADVRRLLVAVALTGDLRTTQAVRIADPGSLDEAVDTGVLTIDGDRVRPSHPLLASAAKTDARTGELRELHTLLAELAPDAESQAVHRALAAHAPDEELAAAVSEAAAAAAGRGARHDAVVLAEHALRLTPAESESRVERVLQLGSYFAAAGDRQRVTDVIAPELEWLPRGAPRVRALLLLTLGAVRDNDEIRAHLTAALEEAGSDPLLRASALIELAENDVVIRVERVATAEARMSDALAAAASPTPELERRGVYSVSWARAMCGKPVEEQRRRFEHLSDTAPFVSQSPERIAGQRLMWRGEVEEARTLLSRLLAQADAHGEAHSYALQRLHLCQLELRIGDCEAAGRLLGEWAKSSERVMWPMYERCRALLAATRGTPAEAERWAARTLERAAVTGTNWDRLEALRARGVAALLTGDAAGAAASLRVVWAHLEREGVTEPGVFPVAPDLVEALVEAGELDEARNVTGRLRDLATEQAHPWGLATWTRCTALLSLDDIEAAGIELTAAADIFATLGLRHDRARTLLALGRAQRRLRKWGAAAQSLDEAIASFESLAATGWVEHARAERARVGGRKPRGGGQLTDTERRVAELAADGLANKEIAASLFMSVRTVEVHLKHAYAKLGIRSRAQIARRLSEGA